MAAQEHLPQAGEGPARRVTIRQVAQAAGVSPSTVSRAFAKPDRVSAATSKRIFAAADELGYYSRPVESVPLRAIRGLIAIIVPDIANQFFSDIIRAVQHECTAGGFSLIVAESQESASRERAAFDHIVSYADGVILVSSRMPDAMIRKCAQTRPLVVVNRSVRGVPSVAIDISTGIAQALDYLVALGFNSLTYLDGPSSSWSVGVRWKCLEAECHRRQVSVRRLWPGAPTVAGGAKFVSTYRENPTGAVMAHNDLMALGFMSAMRAVGYRCPRDFSIIGFDNDMVSQLTQPTLTSVCSSQTRLGTEAARALLLKIKGDLSGTFTASVASQLLVRQSCGALQVSGK
ncbi:LacI family transcriptional regulator [Bombiscardovia nodaiensis]|uniref:LacI family transcriptional regulator n=1 Tax=Bombiscardovia nodaiensis TaxID=2932181 RepID=A0ABN6SC78_9BIFI|nr:LacI family transcriptional regulator [Bombiscardovia nodaiensis]